MRYYEIAPDGTKRWLTAEQNALVRRWKRQDLLRRLATILPALLVSAALLYLFTFEREATVELVVQFVRWSTS